MLFLCNYFHICEIKSASSNVRPYLFAIIEVFMDKMFLVLLSMDRIVRSTPFSFKYNCAFFHKFFTFFFSLKSALFCIKNLIRRRSSSLEYRIFVKFFCFSDSASSGSVAVLLSLFWMEEEMSS